MWIVGRFSRRIGDAARIWRIGIAAGLAAWPGAGAVAGPATALDAIEPGEWELRIANEPPRAICVADPAILLQLRHRRAACSRLTITDTARETTVHYTCPASGWGRTTITVLTPRAVTIDSQGIADNAPFAFTADAHRVGACPGATGHGAR